MTRATLLILIALLLALPGCANGPERTERLTREAMLLLDDARAITAEVQLLFELREDAHAAARCRQVLLALDAVHAALHAGQGLDDAYQRLRAAYHEVEPLIPPDWRHEARLLAVLVDRVFARLEVR